MASPILDLSKKNTRILGVISYTKDGSTHEHKVYTCFWNAITPTDYQIKNFLNYNGIKEINNSTVSFSFTS